MKEQTRCTYNMLTFTKIPRLHVIKIMLPSILWLNMFPVSDRISDTFIPQSIIFGTPPDYKARCKLEFGKCVQNHKEYNNYMNACTIGAFLLGTTSNFQGGYSFSV